MSYTRTRRSDGRKPHKYGAIPTIVDGIRFASKAEARRYSELKLLEQAGQIARLRIQPRFVLCVPQTNLRGESYDCDGPGLFSVVGYYLADFCYDELTPTVTRFVVEDVKGMDTPLSKWKRKHVAAQYGIDVRIVK